MGKQEHELITKSEFARRKSVSPQAVDKAIKSQRIGVVHNDRGRERIVWEIASEQWDKTCRARSDRPHAKPRSIPEQEIEAAEEILIGDDDDDEKLEASEFYINRAITEKYKAKRERQKYLQEKGELVRADDVKFAWSKINVTVKTRVQAIPSKAKIAIPRLTPEEMEVLETMIDETLSEIADWRLGSV